MYFLSLADILLGMVNISAYAAFLISGLVIIAIISIVANVFQFEAPVEKEKKSMTRSIPLEFSISRLRESKDVALPSMVLHSGLLFGSSGLTYNLSIPNDTEEVKLSFDIARTNMYAPLTVRANGFVESRKLPKGSYSFVFGKSSGHMLIYIQPESSSWRIWAPALYEINNTKATINAFKSESSDFSFNLDKELEDLESANLVLQFDKRLGTLVAELNNKTLYSGTAKGIETITINATLLGRENKLVFSALNNSQFSGSGTVVINYME